MYIVGIDIAKRKHEAAVIDGEGAVIIKPFSFTNNCSGYNRLLAMLAKAKLPLDEVSFAMEATGHYWLALFTRLQKEGFRVQVINPVQTNSIRSFYIRQAKTDPRDALLIAEVIRFGHFSESTLHPENIYELRELCRGRHAIVSMQADVKRKVVALLDQVFPEYETAFANRRHQPFFLRGKACRLCGDRSNHAAVRRIQRCQEPYVQTRLALFAARHLAGGFIGGAPRSGAEALFSEKTG